MIPLLVASGIDDVVPWARASSHSWFGVVPRTPRSHSLSRFPVGEKPCAHSPPGFGIAHATREMTTRASGTIKRELPVSCAFPAIRRPGGILGSDG